MTWARTRPSSTATRVASPRVGSATVRRHRSAKLRRSVAPGATNRRQNGTSSTPVITDHLPREAAEKVYGPGNTFPIGLVTLCTNTGTYLDVPFHRYADGHDLAGLPLERVAGVPAVCLDRRGQTTIDLGADEWEGLAGHAVLVRTDHSVHFGTDRYLHDHPHLSAASADALVAAEVACVGIDSLNIDSTAERGRPVHTILLGAGIPIIEHLTNLSALPEHGFTFTAVPPKIEGAGTFTVRAFSSLLPG